MSKTPFQDQGCCSSKLPRPGPPSPCPGQGPTSEQGVQQGEAQGREAGEAREAWRLAGLGQWASRWRRRTGQEARRCWAGLVGEGLGLGNVGPGWRGCWMPGTEVQQT